MLGKLATFMLTCAMASATLADVPDAQQACQQSNAALCRVGDVQFVNVGPCPPEAITVRPPGNGQCSEASPRERPNERPERPGRTNGNPVSAMHPDTRLSAAMPSPPNHKDWRIPSILLAAFVVIVGIISWLVRHLLHRRRVREIRFGLTDLATIIASAIAGFWIAWRGAGWVFAQIVEHYHNADTAGPVLIGALCALIAFMMILAPASGLIALILFKAQASLRK